MILNYKKSESSVEPSLVDFTSSKKYVYVRQNIVEKTKEETGEQYTYYEYEEAKLTKEEYERYLEELGSLENLECIEKLKKENKTLNEQVSMLTDCVLEMSGMIYV